MLNYFNFKKFGEQILLTNDLGKYTFVSTDNFHKMLAKTIDNSSEDYRKLEEKGFVYSGSQEEFLEKIKYDLRTAKSHLLHCTELHIFVLTNACNLQCIYCQARTGDEEKFEFMSFETAERAVDFALQSPDKYLSFEFQGGEPLTNFKVIRHIVEYAEQHKEDKNISYSLVSNLLLMTDEILDFIKKYKVGVSTSIDGSRNVHNHNRPYINGNPTYDNVIDKVNILKNNGINPGVIETTTKYSLSYPREMIDAYLKLGINSIFIRPLTPLGYASRNWNEIGYSPEEFLSFYKKCLTYILKLNNNGTYFREGQASIFLKKIIRGEDPNFMELRSPCGGALGQMAYFFNGDIYTCDEGRMLAEMGDGSFRIGNVASSRYDDVICSNCCKAMMSSSFLEALPECCDCVYQPYCGNCPVINYSLGGDIYPIEPNGYKCQINKGILDFIFSILQDENSVETRILKSWVCE